MATTDLNIPYLDTLDLIATCLSFIGASILTWFCSRTNPKSTPLKLLFAIAISDLIYSAANLMSVFETSKTIFLCGVESFLREFSLVLSAFMVTCLALVCYNASKLQTSKDPDLYFKYGLFLGILTGTVLALGPLYVPQLSYENDLILCWINYNQTYRGTGSQMIALLFESVPIALAILVTCIVYVLIIRRIKNLPPMLIGKVGTKVYRLLWYPAVLFIAYIPGLIDITLRIVTQSSLPIWLISMHLILTHSVGFVDALVYGVQMGLIRWRLKKEEPLQQIKQGPTTSISEEFSSDNSWAEILTKNDRL